LKKAAQKLLLVWARAGETGMGPTDKKLLFVHKK
jgi:hypothetical protein